MVLPLTAAAKKATKRFDSEFYVEGYATTFNKPYLLYEFDGVQYFKHKTKYEKEVRGSPLTGLPLFCYERD